MCVLQLGCGQLIMEFNFHFSWIAIVSLPRDDTSCPLPSSCWNLAYISLAKSCASYNNCYPFICIAALLCSEDTFFLEIHQHHWPLNSFCPPFPQWSLYHWRKGIISMFYLGLNILHSVVLCTSCCSLCSYYLLKTLLLIEQRWT